MYISTGMELKVRIRETEERGEGQERAATRGAGERRGNDKGDEETTTKRQQEKNIYFYTKKFWRSEQPPGSSP